MSLPPCFTLLNAGYYNSINAQLAAASTAAELQAIVNKIFADLSLLESTMTSQIELLAPYLAITNPTNLAQLLTFASNMITAIVGPAVAAEAKFVAQLTALGTEVATIEATINEVAHLKFPGITITIPPITIGCSL